MLAFFSIDLKSKAFNVMNECSDHFLARLTNLFMSQVAASTLQIERAIKLLLQMFGKLLDLLKEPEHQKDLEQFRRRIFGYSISRVLPSTSSEDFIGDTGMTIANLVQLYNYFDGLSALARGIGSDFKGATDLLNDRLSFIEQALRTEGVRRLKERAAY